MEPAPPHSLIRYYVSMICCNMQLENTDVLTYWAWLLNSICGPD